MIRSLLVLTVAFSGAAACAQTSASQSSLPDAPSVLLSQQQDVVAVAEASLKASGSGVAPCTLRHAMLNIPSHSRTIEPVRVPCNELVNPYQRFFDTNVVIPLTSKQKGYLAIHNLTDPANLATIVAVAGFSTAIDSHSAYGPGWKGFGKNTGVSLLQDATGEFFGAYLIPSIAHQDPRYFRMPKASIPRRLGHAVSRTFVANHDDGGLMPNYANLLGYPISAELSNLYVPGIHADPASTMARIATGLATDPANNLITEFLPDVAKHISIRIIFVQRILNQVASQQQQGGTTF
ncbi:MULTISPECIES: hypothetical protein [Acidobacteriaceae]|uniref:hypothetical protein n=1 Tax=Acidobacteriaceae TaxID=204434 RepID=UPI00131BA01A|nr:MULTISPECIES: hypothetical protein [Acidobacteriaceae]MDW5264840.1 hypothetical protein [Edaphobacter sp.]